MKKTKSCGSMPKDKKGGYVEVKVKMSKPMKGKKK